MAQEHLNQLRAFNAELAGLEAELAQRDIEREELRTRIDHTRKIVANLAALCGVNTADDITTLGFTDAVRWVMRLNKEKKMNALEIRDILLEKRYDLSGYSNALSSLYTVLGRLTDAGELEKFTDGLATSYQWKRRRKRPFPSARRGFYGSPPVTLGT
jgi:hypothetical protein